MAQFADFFSEVSRDYAQYRPDYPRTLFDFLAEVAPARRLAWDCGTGNGQAAWELAQSFDQVIATDASASQLAHARQHDRIVYRLAAAEQADVPAGAVDLITVAQAAHWFDLPAFYAQVHQAASPGGVLAIWTYSQAQVTPAVDALLDHLVNDVIAGYWPEPFHHVLEGYRRLPFPFPALEAPVCFMEATWDLSQLVGFIHSWSGAQRYQAARGQHPVEVIWTELVKAWGKPEQRRLIRWPLVIKAGRVR